MDWLRRLFGGRSDVPSPAAADDCLRRAGWAPGRACDIAPVEDALQRAGFVVHDAARSFLREHYELAVDVPVNGADGITGFVHFVPEMVLRFLGPGDREKLSALMPRGACPVGTTSGHTVFVFLDEDGKSYLL